MSSSPIALRFFELRWNVPPLSARFPRHVYPPPEVTLLSTTASWDPQWSDPLLLLMAALTALETGVITALSLARPEMARRLSDHEIARIRKFAPPQERYAGDLLVQLAAFATLCGGLSREHALSAAVAKSAALGLEYPGGHGAAILDLRNALPGSDEGIDRIQPDLIGDAFLLQVWKHKPPSGSLPQALAVADRSVVNVPVRAAQDFTTEQEARPVQWLDELIVNTTNCDLLSTINDALPLETICLREFSLRVVERLIQREDHSFDRASLLLHLSNRQSGLGPREQALASIQEAIYSS